MAGLRTLLLFGLVLLGAACSSPPPPPPPTVLDLTLVAAKDLNPDITGRPAPVVVRVYQLASDTAFNQADFFALFDRDAATLGRDLVAKEEIALTPDSNKAMTMEFKPEAKFVGLLAAYRDVDRATWRLVKPVPPNQTSTMKVQVGSNALVIAPEG